MTEEQYERSIQIKERIQKIDNLNKFLRQLSNNPSGAKCSKAVLRESGFIAHPEEISIWQDDIDCWMGALDSEKACLEHEFNRL